MNDEQFEATMECLRDELADKLRARDTAQREALARVEAERDTAVVQMQNIRKERDAINKELGDAGFNLCIAQQQLAEAVGLLREVNSQRFTTLATVEIIESFIGRHSQTFHDRAQAEHQEAQGAQAGGERAAFEGWYRRTLSPGATFNKNPDGSYESGNCQGRWLTWQARAALATQPAAGEPEQQNAINADDLPTKKYPLDAFDFDAPVASGEPVAWMVEGAPKGNLTLCKLHPDWAVGDSQLAVTPLYAATPAAAHGDEAVLPDNLRSHRLSWLNAMERLIELEPGGLDPTAEDLNGYWCHELQAMRDMYADLDRIDAMRAQGDGGDA